MHQKDGPQRRTAKWIPQAAETNNAEEEDESSWRDKPLHGIYHRRTEEVDDNKKSYKWLEKAGLKDSTQEDILKKECLMTGVKFNPFLD